MLVVGVDDGTPAVDALADDDDDGAAAAWPEEALSAWLPEAEEWGS